MSFRFLLIVIFYCSIAWGKEPSIIYLKGTCSAGKSTLIRSLSEQNENLEIVDEDTMMHRSYVQAVEERFSEELLCIRKAISEENLYHALREKDVFFKKDVTEGEANLVLDLLKHIQDELNLEKNLSWKQEVSRGIDKEVLGRIQKGLETGKDVIVDAWYIKPEHLYQCFPGTEVHRVLIYCPIEMAYERFLKRNQEAMIQGNLTEKRYVRQLLGSFFSMYQITNDPTFSLEEIHKEEFDQVLDRIYLTLPEKQTPLVKSVFTFDEISKTMFLTLKKKFLEPFEESGKTFYIMPKDSYDLIIYTK